MSSAPRPNILFVLTDQQRFDALGCAGNRQIQTPHLDELAADAAYYPVTYCPYPMCTPSRYSLWSGRYVHQTGAYANRSTLAPGIPAFPRVLRDAGYRTAAVGKMHFNPTYQDIGFERLVLAEQDGDGRFDDDYHRALRAAGLVDALDLIDQRGEYRSRAPRRYWETCGAIASNLPEAWHSTSWIGARALEHLEGWTGGGNFLVASFIKPHHPFDPPAEWVARYDESKLDPLPGWTPEVPAHDLAQARGYFPNDELTEPVLRRVMAHYYASISHIDAQVGNLVRRLKEKGLYDDTVIVYTSDHGEFLGHHHMILKGNYPYEPLARVPLLVKFPGGRGAGRRETLANLVDLAPTLLRQAGLETPKGMGGLNLADPDAARPYVFQEWSGQGHYVARSKRYKLIYGPQEERCFFYDLESDPYELANRYRDTSMQEEVMRHREALVRWRLFEAPQPEYRDYSAQPIRGENVPGPGLQHRADAAAYFERACAGFFEHVNQGGSL